jgi:5-methylcytosine-specific restriction enzyme A
MARLVGREFDRADVLRALAVFDREWSDTHLYDDWLAKRSYRYALSFNGRLYPPKRILSLATGVDIRQFSGGVAQTNRILCSLGFEVIRKPAR